MQNEHKESLNNEIDKTIRSLLDFIQSECKTPHGHPLPELVQATARLIEVSR